MKRVFLFALALLILLPLSFAVNCSDAGVTTFAKSAVMANEKLNLDINVSYKAGISVYSVEVLSPDSKLIATDSFAPQVLIGASAIISRTNLTVSKTGAYIYRLYFYLNTPSSPNCTSSGSFVVVPETKPSAIPDTNIFAILAALISAVAVISFRKK